MFSSITPARSRFPHHALTKYLLLLLLLTSPLLGRGQTTLHYWNFNNPPSATAPRWGATIPADAGTGVLTHSVTNSDAFQGTTVNAESGVPAGLTFSVVSASLGVNNGKILELSLPSTGFSSLIFSYALQGTTTGFLTNAISYSTDGSTFTNLRTVIPSIGSFTTQTFDFSQVAGVNNNPKFKVRITLDGSTGANGNNRIDNLKLVSTTPRPLPVELVRFGAQRQGSAVRVQWATASEKNNARFEVQRSATGHEFRTLATAPGQGTSASGHTYSLLDQQPLPGTGYYRLRQVDTNGQDSFSEVVAIAAPGELVLYPNPVSRVLYLQLPAAGAHYRIIGALGSTVLEGTAPDGSAQVDMGTLPAGLYQLEVTTGASRSIRQFIKQ